MQVDSKPLAKLAGHERRHTASAASDDPLTAPLDATDRQCRRGLPDRPRFVAKARRVVGAFDPRRFAAKFGKKIGRPSLGRIIIGEVDGANLHRAATFDSNRFEQPQESGAFDRAALARKSQAAERKHRRERGR